MKKKTPIFFLLLALTFLRSAYAANLGNPSEILRLSKSLCTEDYLNDPLPYGESTQWFETLNYRLGFSGSYVFDRKMKTNVYQLITGLPNPAYQLRALEVAIHTNSAYFICNFCKNFDFFFALGSSGFKILGASSLFNLSGILNQKKIFISNGIITLQTKSGHSELVGLRYAKEIFNSVLGLHFGYTYAKPVISIIEVISGNTQFNLLDNQENKPNYLQYKEWDIGATLSRNFSYLSGYIGLNCSKATINMNKKTLHAPKNIPNPFLGDIPLPDSKLTEVSLKLNSLENKIPLGLTIGLSLFANNKASLTVETKLVNQYAVGVTSLIRF